MKPIKSEVDYDKALGIPIFTSVLMIIVSSILPWTLFVTWIPILAMVCYCRRFRKLVFTTMAVTAALYISWTVWAVWTMKMNEPKYPTNAQTQSSIPTLEERVQQAATSIPK